LLANNILGYEWLAVANTLAYNAATIIVLRFLKNLAFVIVLGNNIEQTTSAYYLNAYNEVLIKLAQAKHKQTSLALLKHLLIFIVVNRVIIFKMLPKYFSNKLGFILDPSLSIILVLPFCQFVESG
jgi:hypothetical protein